MNPSFKFILIFLISLELSIKTSLVATCCVIIFSLFYLIWHKIRIKDLLLLLLIPLLAAVTVFSTLYWFSEHTSHYYAWVLSSRIYAYVLSIACVVKTTTATSFARSLEQNLHLPSKFAYGVLAALNLFPEIKTNIKRIRASAAMRGVSLGFWSPSLYFKAILSSISSADNLAQAMESHGFKEDQPRSTIIAIPVKTSDWILLLSILLIFNFILWIFK